MTTLVEKQTALKEVSDAATIHAASLQTSIMDRDMNPSFKAARRQYMESLTKAINVVNGLKLDETTKVVERVADLDLEEATDLLHAVEDHIRSLRRSRRSKFA